MDLLMGIVKKSLSAIFGLIGLLAMLAILSAFAGNFQITIFLFIVLAAMLILLVSYFGTSGESFGQRFGVFMSDASMGIVKFFSFSKSGGVVGYVGFFLKIIALVVILWLIAML
jgi:hypothetical protein